MSPPPSSQALAKIKAGITSKRSRRILKVLAAILGLFIFYLLALGPLLRIYGVRPSSGWNRLPAVVRVIYAPIDKLPIPEPVAGWLRAYNRWWMRASSEGDDFIRAMAQLDQAIPLGTSQSEVLRALGEPVFWTTNAGLPIAHYSFPTPFITFDVLTNGIILTFSNGVVVAKSPSMVMSTGKRNRQ